MQLQHIQSHTTYKDKKRVGRGGKRGTTSGRGTKGQNARSGSKKIRPAIYDLIKKLPKLRGWKMKSLKDDYAIVHLADLAKTCKEGETVTARLLMERKVVSKIKGTVPQVKILDGGSFEKKLVFQGISFSKSARAAIEKAGGTIS